VIDQPTISILDAGSKSGNRGWDAALSAAEMVDLLDSFRMDMP
jgi:6,7-dimethyl-8-ribityllumazine synthase